MKPFLAALRIGFAHVFVYRAEIAIQLVSACIVAALNGSLWTAALQGRTEVAGVASVQMLSYVLVAWTGVTFVATRVNEEIGNRVRDGLIAGDLLRPMSVQVFWYARDLGRAGACLLVQTLPLFALCTLFFPVAEGNWPGWLVALSLAHAVNYGLSFLVGLATLRIRSVSGLTHLKSTMVSIFSGALIPLALFPEALRDVVRWLPFAAMAHAPASIFLGGEVAPILAGQAAWAFALWMVGWWAWKAALPRVTIQGG